MKTNTDVIFDLTSLAFEIGQKIDITMPSYMPNRVAFKFKKEEQVSEFVKVLYKFYKHRFTFYPFESVSGFSLELSEFRDRYQIEGNERIEAIKFFRQSSGMENSGNKQPIPSVKKITKKFTSSKQVEINPVLKANQKAKKDLIKKLKEEGKLGTRPEPVEYLNRGKKSQENPRKQPTKRLQDFEEYRKSQ